MVAVISVTFDSLIDTGTILIILGYGCMSEHVMPKYKISGRVIDSGLVILLRGSIIVTLV